MNMKLTRLTSLVWMASLGIHAAPTSTFIQPACRLGSFQLARLRQSTTAIRDPVYAEAFQKLNADVERIIPDPPQARPRVYLGYNYAPHDLKKLDEKDQLAAKDNQRRISLIQDEPDVANHTHWIGDMDRIYQLSIAFAATSDPRFSSKAIEIINKWTETCKEFGEITQNGPLEAGWGVSTLLNAVQVLKNVPGSGWTDQSETTLRLWVNNLLLPQLKHHDIINTVTGRNKLTEMNNWGTAIMEGLLMVSVLNGDHASFIETLGKSRQWISYSIQPNGRMNETLRDIVHAQYGLGGILNIAEVAYQQGIPDIYTFNDNAIAKAMEYHARIILNDIPQDLEGVPLKWNGYLPTSWEIGLNHYQGRLEYDLPYTKRLISNRRPEAYTFQWGLGTLTHSNTFLLEKTVPTVPILGDLHRWIQALLGVQIA